jgi:hypothetical protein
MMDHHHHAHALHSVPILTTLAAKNGGGGHEAEKKTATLEAKQAPTPEANHNPFDPETEKITITTPQIENHLSGHDIESRPTTIALDEDHRFESADESLTRDKDQQVHRAGPEDYVAVDIETRSSLATGLGMMTQQEESNADRDAAPMESTMMGNAGWSHADSAAGSDFVEASHSDDKNSTTMESLDTAASNHHLALEGGNGLNLGQETQDMMMTDDDDEGNDDEEEEDEVATIVPTMMTALTGPTQLSP